MSRIPPPPSSLPTWEECTIDGVRYLKIISNDSTNNDLYYADTDSGTPSPVPFAQPAGKWDPELRKRWPPLVWDKKLKRSIHLSSRSPTSHQLLSEHDSQTKWSFFHINNRMRTLFARTDVEDSRVDRCSTWRPLGHVPNTVNHG